MWNRIIASIKLYDVSLAENYLNSVNRRIIYPNDLDVYVLKEQYQGEDQKKNIIETAAFIYRMYQKENVFEHVQKKYES